MVRPKTSIPKEYEMIMNIPCKYSFKATSSLKINTGFLKSTWFNLFKFALKVVLALERT